MTEGKVALPDIYLHGEEKRGQNVKHQRYGNYRNIAEASLR